MSGKKKGNKLKLNQVTSVDLCPQGANPDADICLFKSTEGQPQSTPPATASTDDEERSFFKKMADFFQQFAQPGPAAAIEKDAQSFSAITARQEINDNLWRYMTAFEQSVRSIVDDGDVEAAQKDTLLNDSLEQFSEKMKSLFPALIGTTTVKTDDNDTGEIGKSTKEGDDDTMEFNFDNIDKSVLTAEELATFEALAQKSMKKPEETPPVTEPAAKSIEPPAPAETNKTTDPALTAALAKVEALTKSLEANIEKQEKAMELEVAKKYVNLGEKPEELADTLYALKKSNEGSYNAFIGSLDKALATVEKSGIFGEIGKSTHGDVDGGDAYVKAENIAKKFMAEEGLDYNSAMMKAWDQNPDLIREYEGK